MKYFCDNISVITDRMGGWNSQCIDVGWYDKESSQYYNLDEVRKLYDAGETLNVSKREDGTLFMDTCWLDFRTAFTVVCGIAFGEYENFPNLYEYAKNHNIVTSEPQQIRMYAGTKQLLIENGKYSIEYKIHDSIWSHIVDHNEEFIRKICIGKINKLRHKYTTIYFSDNKQCKKHHLICSDVSFDDRTLLISDINSEYVGSTNLIDAIRILDLQILMSLTDQVDFSDIHSAVYDMCLNLGQPHWMGIQDDTLEDSDVYWYDKPFKE